VSKDSDASDKVYELLPNLLEGISLSENRYPYLYPELTDTNFNRKIAEKKEFYDTRYDGTIYKVDKQAEKLSKSEFELLPHQQFVRNFLSFQTPYNSLLLYHGLGSGKTCSAIGIAEEMRDYNNQLGLSQKIIIVASPNVQENFKLQLFDETKLKNDNGLWNMRSCTGNKYLREINPTNMKGLSREKIISQIKRLIKTSYAFYGYIEFANIITKLCDIGADIKNKASIIKSKLRKHFNNHLIIIDEVHNLRITDDNENKRAAQELIKLVENVDNLRLLFLSATPLYNTYKEIIWLINIMNLNDGRSIINVKDVFDKDGNFKSDTDGREIGREILERKATGYISYVRGNNPYTFPYRIMPDEFAKENTLSRRIYPTEQLNGKLITQKIKHLSLYVSNMEDYQSKCYNYIINKLKSRDFFQQSNFSFEKLQTLGHIILQQPLEALNIIYPNITIDNILQENASHPEDIRSFDIKELIGKNGLNNTMTYIKSQSPPAKTNYEYKEDVYEKYGRIFSQNEIGKYSSKIKAICNNIMNSDGIVLIYSQYLDGGIVPIALALEEMGITRYGNTKSLFKTPPVPSLDLKTYTNIRTSTSIPAKYIMITGDKLLSPKKEYEENIQVATDKANKNGHKIKVILISMAGSEGIDLKYIRQVHLLEPWYNMSRIEQIIGRAVRNFSHIDLPFDKRNVEIFLHGSILQNEQQEAADLYLYRLAESKAIQIGKVNRLLKEISIDCLLNSQQMNFTSEIMDQTVLLRLSNGNRLEYKIGDKPYSEQCDYMESCTYKCKPESEFGNEIPIDSINNLSYTENFMHTNNIVLIQRINQLMKEQYFYKKLDLIKHININKSYPIEQIYSALDKLVNDKNEFITDKYGRLGNLVNIGEYYFYQPLEILEDNISLYDRQVPIPYKESKLIFIPEKEKEEKEEKKEKKDKEKSLKKLLLLPDGKAKTVNITHSKKKDTSELNFSEGKQIINSMFKNYQSAKTESTIIKGTSDWYTFSSVVLKILRKEKVPEIILDKALTSHLIEEIMFNNLLKVINYLYNSENLTDFEKNIKSYFQEREIKDKKLVGIYLQKEGEQKLIIKNSNIWVIAKPEDYNDLSPVIGNILTSIKSKLNNVIGFIADFKKDYMIFKVKQLQKRNKGARCDQSGKIETIKLLNLIVGTQKYTAENTKHINQKQLCVLQEYILRIYDYNNKDGKRWFLDPYIAILINIEKI